jgi:hypothetical protein
MPAKPNEIQITRVYDAPVKLVWEVWTELEHVKKWWGPRGFTLTTKSFTIRLSTLLLCAPNATNETDECSRVVRLQPVEACCLRGDKCHRRSSGKGGGQQKRGLAHDHLQCTDSEISDAITWSLAATPAALFRSSGSRRPIGHSVPPHAP